jgi:hypothetical protein
MSQQVVFVRALQGSGPLEFAAEELVKYLRKMGIVAFGIGTPRMEAEPETDEQSWRIDLGLFSDFGIQLSEESALEIDDHIWVDLTQDPGIVAGSNPRSVLLAVYRLLVRAGCRFIRPGNDGEIIPTIIPMNLRLKFEESPSYRHRGLCIEGAVSLEHMLDSVDWAPKVGLNAYFLEFMIPFTFFDRWYRHMNNPQWPAAPVSVGQVLEFRLKIEEEIRRRGLTYHNPGHGWTCEPLGLAGLGWDSEPHPLPEEVSQYLAEVNGVREVYQGIPLNTQLCYSNPQARKQVVEYAVQYVRKYPHIDFLHVWLGDNANNFCECSGCRDHLPSDQYVTLLNEMDAAFIELHIPCRIVFIAYLDLLWPPQKQTFTNPDRFVLLFAPISRSYSLSYDDDTAGLLLPEYKRNHIVLPSGIRENLLFLKEWKKFFRGDSFTYEYYFMWDHYLDPGYYNTARILHADVRKLSEIGLNGIISDQTQRAYFPTGFGMHVLARTLWDSSADFASIADDYFRTDFGPDGPLVQSYLSQLSDLFDPPYLRGENDQRDECAHVWILENAGPGTNPQAASKLSQIPALVQEFRPIIERNLVDPDPCRAMSWMILMHHTEIVPNLARAFEACAMGEKGIARKYWQKVQSYVQQYEIDLHKVLDVFEFITVLGARFPETMENLPDGSIAKENKND